MTHAPQPLWEAPPTRRKRANVTRYLRWLEECDGRSFAGYDALWRWSTDELEVFWDSVWRFYDVRASTPPAAVLDERRMPGARWFAGARLNYAEHVLDRAPAEQAAIVEVAEGPAPMELTGRELRGQVGALAATLREMSVGPGDRVAVYLPNISQAVVALLAVTSLGATCATCSPDFGTRSVIDRFGQIEPKVLVAVDGYRFGGRDHERLATVAELQAALPTLGATIVVRSLRPAEPLPHDLGAIAFDEAVRDHAEPIFEHVDFDHPLWILFSSGTTGLPKGIVHSHGGILLEHLKALGLCLDLGPRDRYLFYCSTSWMAWNYLVGGLLHGSTIVLYSGSPAAPGPDALWRVAAATGATVLGMGSAYVTGCEKAGADPAGDGIDLRALRTVIPTGSPLPSSGWHWLHAQLGGDVRIDSICGGTDVCTAFFGGSELLPVHLGEISCRWLGVAAQARDAHGREVVGEVGEFVVTEPMPSMPVKLWNDPGGARYRAAYFELFPGAWRQGDWITIGARGEVTVSGRSDATLNRGGVRLGSAEIYGAVERLPEIADSLVVGVELEDGGYYMPLFVVPAQDGADGLAPLVAEAIRTHLSPRHIPDEVVVAPAIPRTLTGKKLEVPVKRILQGTPPAQAAAAGSIDSPDMLEWFARFAAVRRSRSGAPGR